ncbi:hypothetical protein IFM89_002828 [Coptis chinensis]|uniref:MADS-box domain-containing protein n=1 Tax=Coptis chinensis TaxID=261450 RepID=A0A835HVP8_9MAGN|nr:hypothetical protein IFM89_002828 [Coptis chinensis]
MPRQKVKLAWIAKAADRKTSFRKRKNGLMKKVSDLSTLCAVDACAIIYKPNDPVPDIWHSPSEAYRVLMRFKSLPRYDQTKHMFDQEVYLEQRLAKQKEKLKCKERLNREDEVKLLMYQSLIGEKGVHELRTEDFGDLVRLIEKNVKEVEEKIEAYSRTPTAPQMLTSNEPMQIDGGDGGGDNTLNMTIDDDGDNNALDMTDIEALIRQEYFMEMMNPTYQAPNGNDLMMQFEDTTLGDFFP